jgi:hypothetical protein
MLNFRNFLGFRGTGTKHTSCAELNWIRGVLSPILMVPNVDSYYSKCCHTQGKAVKMLAAGAEHTAAVTESGKLYGWGWAQYGNLGLGDRCDQMVPVEVVAVNREKIKMVACGWRHTITVAESGNLYTFGWSKYGQLGHGNFQDHLVPHQVHALRNKKIRSVCVPLPHCSFFHVFFFFCSIWSLSDINHVKKEQKIGICHV